MSPIHDQSYRRYAGVRAALGRSWTVIAWAGIRNMIRKRVFMGLLIFSSADRSEFDARRRLLHDRFYSALEFEPLH